MRSVVAYGVGSSALVALLFTASCLEPDRNNGEPCLSDDQCESNYCRAGVCATPPDTHESSNLPTADAASEAADDAASEAADDASEDVVSDVADDVGDADLDVDDDASEGGTDAATDAVADVAGDAPDEASDAAGDI